MLIEPFEIDVPEQAIDDLLRRLRNSRAPLLTPGEPWQQGVDGAWLRELLAYWADGFDWRAAERELNRLPQFVADVGGQRVHFAHRRGAARGRIRIRSSSRTAGRVRSSNSIC